MPSVSGWALQQRASIQNIPWNTSFYALGIGLGIATLMSLVLALLEHMVSMPSVSGWALRHADTVASKIPLKDGFLCPRYRAGHCDQWHSAALDRARDGCFYALGIGLGIATEKLVNELVYFLGFLCPRYRAGHCDGCPLEGPLTCGFDARYAGLAARGQKPVRFPLPKRRRGHDLRIPAR